MERLFSGLHDRIGFDAEVEWLIGAVLSVAIAAFLGHIAARSAAPSIRSWLAVRLGDRALPLAKRLGDMFRYGTGALVLIVATIILPFPPFALMVVAIGLGGAMGLLLFTALRAAGLPLWVAGILGGGGFTLAVAATLGGVAPLASELDRAGFNVGSRRVSLLGIVTFGFVAALLFAVTHIINRLLAHAVGRLTALDLSQRVLVQKLGSIAVVIAACLLGIDILDIDLTTLTVFSGALGLAVGFGLQKTFGNLIAGLILLMDKSVKPGDIVAVGDTFGAVNKIGVRAVSVITRDGKEHLIPNEQLMTQAVENWSFSSREVRIHIPVGISYDSDLHLAQKLMIQAAKASRRVLATPEPTVWLKAFGERSLEHDIMVWILDPEQGVGNVQSEILSRLWTLFHDHGIGLPFPQRDVRLRVDTPLRGEVILATPGESGSPPHAPTLDG